MCVDILIRYNRSTSSSAASVASTAAQEPSRQAKVPTFCRDFERGFCRFGARCKYIHKKRSDQQMYMSINVKCINLKAQRAEEQKRAELQALREEHADMLVFLKDVRNLALQRLQTVPAHNVVRQNAISAFIETLENRHALLEKTLHGKPWADEARL